LVSESSGNGDRIDKRELLAQRNRRFRATERGVTFSVLWSGFFSRWHTLVASSNLPHMERQSPESSVETGRELKRANVFVIVFEKMLKTIWHTGDR